jgi:hypothetical protein
MRRVIVVGAFDEVTMFWSEQYGTRLHTIGRPSPAAPCGSRREASPTGAAC